MKKVRATGMNSGVKALISSALADSFLHTLFDSNFYAQQLPQFAQPSERAIIHFLNVGENFGLSPHPVFDRKYVLEQAKENGVDIKDNFSPFAYVLQNDLSPNRLFSKEIYSRHLKNAGVEKSDKETHIEHFLTNWVKYRVPFSPYFDVQFYELNNPHLIMSGTNPLDHYFRVPRRERADANPMFHAGYYVNTYSSWENDPLVDFIAQGCGQLNLPNPYAAQELLSDAFITPENLLKYIEIRND